MKFGLIIVVVALMGSILLGSVALSNTTYEVTSYDRVADLTPIVDSTAVMGDTNYNPTSNLTGWQNVEFTLQDSPSIYPHFEPGTIDELATLSGVRDIWSSGSSAYYPYNASQILTYDGDDTAALIYNNSTIYPDDPQNPGNNDYIIVNGGYTRKLASLGGYSTSASGADSSHAGTTVAVRVDGTTYTAAIDSAIYWQKLNTIFNNRYDSGAMVYGAASSSSYGIIIGSETQMESYSTDEAKKQQNLSVEFSATLTTIQGDNFPYRAETTTTLVGSSTAVTDLFWWNNDRQTFYPIVSYTGDGEPIYVETPTTLYVYSNDYSGDFLTVYEYVPGDRQYITPYSTVELHTVSSPPAIESTWSNGYSNTAVQMIIDPHTGFNTNKTDLTTLYYLPEDAKSYSLVLVTLMEDRESSYWQGLTSYTNTTEFTVIPYHYPLTGSMTALLPNGTINSISFAPMSASPAAIVNTWVPADPLQLLWSNPSMDAHDYFSDIYVTGARIVFSSFVRTGDSMTINGQTLNVSDGRMEVDGKSEIMAGMAVDYRRDGHVYLEFLNGDEYDLGSLASYGISGSGVWYWSATMNTITTVIKEGVAAAFGESSEKNWLIFAYIGICVAAIVAIVAIGKGSLDIMDWLIVAVSIALALVLI